MNIMLEIDCSQLIYCCSCLYGVYYGMSYKNTNIGKFTNGVLCGTLFGITSISLYKNVTILFPMMLQPIILSGIFICIKKYCDNNICSKCSK